MIGEDHVRVPLGASREERVRAWAGGEVDFAGRDVLLVKRAEDTYDEGLYSFWKGAVDELDVFTPDGNLWSFTYSFTPLGYKYRSVTEYAWTAPLEKYAAGGSGTDAELRAEPLIAIFEPVVTCVRGDRIFEGVVAANAVVLARLQNEMRRRILRHPG